MKKLLIAFCMMGCILVGSAQGKITYIDVTPDNATLDGAALVLDATYSLNYTNVTDNLWGYRTNRTDVNGAGVWVTDGGAIVGDAESTAPLKIVITLPEAGVLYDLYAIMMNNNSNNGYWDVSARIGESGDFRDYNKNSKEMTQALASDFEGTVKVSGGGDMTVKVLIGYYVTTTANETVSIYINGFDTWKNGASYDQRTRFDGVGYEVSNSIYEVSPYDGQLDVAAADVFLSWVGGIDPNVVGHRVYLGTAADTLTCLNPTTMVPVGTGTYNIGDIATDTTYYWQIEMVEDNGHGGYPAGDPNNVLGPVWSFTTILSKPIINANPSNQVVAAGDTAEFAVGVESLTTPTFKWYHSADNVTNTSDDDVLVGTSQMLSLSNAAIASEGYYYCVVNNESNIEVASLTASLAITRMAANWTFDQADYVNGQYLDKSGNGHHAEPNGVPTFAAGKIGDGIHIECKDGKAGPTTQSWARAGTWSPSELSGMLTISFWLKWDGPDSVYTEQVFISKRSSANLNDATHWQLTTTGSNTILLQSPNGYLSANGALVKGQWQYIAATFDGKTGVIYINGKLTASGNFALGNAADAMINLGGSNFNNVPGKWFNGTLDDVKLYNYALSDLAVAQMYVADNPGSSVCVNSLKPAAAYDLNGDCIVNLGDFAILAGQWLDCGLVPDCVQ